MIKEKIHNAIKAALIEIGAPEASFVVERPSSLEHGDYATNAALAAAKSLKQNPREVAEHIAKHIALPQIEKVEVAGAGFINFFLNQAAIAEEVENAATNTEWGNNEAL
jgi:arginyl-tRNA synthetase